MRRREFITLLSGSATLWPCVSRAQERNHHPKIGVILNYSETDPEGKSRFSALKEQLGKLGWADANNVEIEVRWAAGKTDLMLAFSTQFVSQPVDIIVANSTPSIAVLKQLTSTIPIVFVQVADPVGSGFVSNYAHPGGNITGFTDFRYIDCRKMARGSQGGGASNQCFSTRARATIQLSCMQSKPLRQV